MRSLVLTLLVLLLSNTEALADNQRPSIVKNVSANALSTDSIRVSWNTPWDNVRVVGYNIYRNGSYFATLYNATNYLDKNLNANTAYRYSIVAFDKARNYSVLSSTASATTQGGNAGSAAAPDIAAPPPASNGNPNAPSGLRAEVQSLSKAKLFWNAPSGSVSGYNIYRNGSYLTTVRSTTQYTATSLNKNQEYRFAVVAFNGDRFSIKSTEVRIRTDSGSPSAASTSQSAPTSSNDNASSGAVPSGYRLIFKDEFRARKLDASKWNSRYRWGPRWTINNEVQYYVDHLSDPDFGHSPFELDGEHLTISAIKTPGHLRSKANNKAYLSGALTTYNKFKMRYGYVEMRAKLPKGQGLWPAFWLLHNQENGNRPEIDVVELLGKQPTIAYQTYHYYDNWTLRSTPSYQAKGPDYSRAFHTYSMKWEPGRITWYVDGKATNSYNSGNVSKKDMYLLVNLALGGSWAGNPNGSTPFPARFTIDYIRAYGRP